MEGRKLQLAGGSTYLVSLPKRWVLNAGLKAGDTLFVDTAPDGTVSVRPHAVEKPAARRKVFQEKGEEARDHLLRKLIGAYISGFGIIEVRFPPDRAPFVRRVSREFCRLVIGPEVIEEGRNSIVIQDLSDPSELSSEKCLRRMHLTVRAMVEDAISALKKSDSTLARDVALRDQDVDRLYWMVAKQFHLSSTTAASHDNGFDQRAIHGYQLVGKLLERIGDHAQRIAETYPVLAEGKTLDPKLIRDLEEAATSAVAVLDRAFNALISGDIEAANEAIDARGENQKLIDALSHRVAIRKGEELLALGTVVNSLGRTARYAADIAEQAINMAILMDREPK
ncbi:MAG TPA: phosphate uptake regulator PhoU [Thermoplasmata archaeon]|nr:phosphate uptake regulator PhoU [Thermoplasmata archaeon]